MRSPCYTEPAESAESFEIKDVSSQIVENQLVFIQDQSGEILYTSPSLLTKLGGHLSVADIPKPIAEMAESAFRDGSHEGVTSVGQEIWKLHQLRLKTDRPSVAHWIEVVA